MKNQSKLFIEGDGKLRQGFHKLLSKVVSNRPRIVMGGNRDDTIRKFRNDASGHTKYLLVDLDKPETEREKVIHAKDLKEHDDRTFFMIQEMEGWFFTQHDKLNKKWNTSAFSDYKSKKGISIHNPKNEIKDVLRQKVGKQYNEVRDGVDILTRLDVRKLRKHAQDFDEIIKLIKREL